MDDNVPMVASALAYSTFLAIPWRSSSSPAPSRRSASPDDITTVTERIGEIAPEETVTLLRTASRDSTARRGRAIVMILIGFLVALWSTTSAMTTFMTGVNTVYDVEEEQRSFVRRRIVALALVGVGVVAFVTVFGLLVLGPQLAGLVADHAGGWATWAWWAGQWPVLLLVLLVTFAAMLYWAPNVDQPKWTLVSPGAVFWPSCGSPRRACSRSTRRSSARTTRSGARSPR